MRDRVLKSLENNTENQDHQSEGEEQPSKQSQNEEQVTLLYLRYVSLICSSMLLKVKDLTFYSTEG